MAFYRDVVGFHETDMPRFYFGGGGPDDPGMGFAFMHADNGRHHLRTHRVSAHSNLLLFGQPDFLDAAGLRVDDVAVGVDVAEGGACSGEAGGGAWAAAGVGAGGPGSA